MDKNIKAVINFAYFTANFPLDFIEKCWENETWLAEHLRSKLHSKSNGSFISSGAFLRFFLELDQTNQVNLCEWIEKNYKSFSDF